MVVASPRAPAEVAAAGLLLSFARPDSPQDSEDMKTEQPLTDISNHEVETKDKDSKQKSKRNRAPTGMFPRLSCKCHKPHCKVCGACSYCGQCGHCEKPKRVSKSKVKQAPKPLTEEEKAHRQAMKTARKRIAMQKYRAKVKAETGKTRRPVANPKLAVPSLAVMPRHVQPVA
eukprot:GFYU01010120.1.p1 GENE.GFYU01010120.1~~GFYU01010120.1.p1  ORF type:complete len:173 (-),score=30.11 GFYU01010120.1:148-666(-)